MAFQDGLTRSVAAIHYSSLEEQRLSRPVGFARPGFVVPNGVDVSGTVAAGENESLANLHPILAGRKVVLFLARLHRLKGICLLVQALARLARQRSDIALVLAGPDYGAEQAVRRLASELGVADRVVFTGMLQGEAKAAALRDADVFVLPSHSENFGISVVEALAARLPVVISDRVGLWRDITAADAGVVTTLDVDAVAQGIARVLDNPHEAARMAAAGYALVRSKYDWAAIGAQLEGVYEQVVRDAARQRAGPAGGLRDSRLTQSSVG